MFASYSVQVGSSLSADGLQPGLQPQYTQESARAQVRCTPLALPFVSSILNRPRFVIDGNKRRPAMDRDRVRLERALEIYLRLAGFDRAARQARFQEYCDLLGMSSDSLTADIHL